MSPAARSNRQGQDDDRADVPVRLAPLHVFGYNGATGGGNVKHLATGQVIYDAGAHIILLNPTTRDMEIFTGHSEEVACFALHPDGVRVASGDSGFEPTVLVWDSTNLLNLGSLKPFDHAVDDNITGKTKCAGSIDGLGYRLVASLIP
jgi:WD40 repeat protein